MFKNVLIFIKLILPVVLTSSIIYCQVNTHNVLPQNNNSILSNSFIINTIIEFKNSDLSSTNYYKIIGIPGDTTISLQSVMTGASIKDWIAFYDDGGDFYIPYTEANKGQFNFSPGKAYWILSKYDIKLGPYSVSSVKLTNDNCYEVPLHKNWNLISNPFDKSINWQDVRTANNIQNDLIYYFHSGSYNFSSVKMEPFLGFYYYNRKNLDKLKLPYPTNTNLEKNQNSNPFETIAVNITDGNKTTGVLLLLDDSFSEGLDDYDQILPPMDFSTFAISIMNNSLPNNNRELAIESLNNINNNLSIPLKIRNKNSNTIELSINYSDNLNDRFYAIYNPQDNSKINLNNNQIINLELLSTEQDYLLLIGTSEFVESFQKDLLPNNLELYQNYPNPFNPETVIQFDLPKSGFVNITVFNSIGQKISELVNGFITEGKHSVSFKSNNLSSGNYFYQLKTENSVITKKMVLLQ